MPYVDPNTVHTPTTGAVAPAAWGTVIRDDLEFLIDPPSVSAFNSGAQVLTTAVLATLAADSENFDNDTMHNTVSNNSRITIQTAGRYLFIAMVEFASGNAGHRSVSFRIDGTDNIPAVSQPTVATGATTTGLTATRMLSLTVGQFVEVRAFQNQGTNLGATLHEFAALFMTR